MTIAVSMQQIGELQTGRAPVSKAIQGAQQLE